MYTLNNLLHHKGRMNKLFRHYTQSAKTNLSLLFSKDEKLSMWRYKQHDTPNVDGMLKLFKLFSFLTSFFLCAVVLDTPFPIEFCILLPMLITPNTAFTCPDRVLSWRTASELEAFKTRSKRRGSWPSRENSENGLKKIQSDFSVGNKKWESEKKKILKPSVGRSRLM